MVKVKDTEQDGVSQHRPALSFPPCHVACGPNHGTGCIYGDKGKQSLEVYAKFWEPSVPGVALGRLIKYCPRAGVYDLPGDVLGGVGTPGSMSNDKQS